MLKRSLAFVLVAATLLGAVFFMTSCGKDTASDGKEDIVIPEGWEVYDNGYISFAYPEAWNVTEGGVTMIQDAATGNNISVTYEAKTDLYAALTMEDFQKTYVPLYAQMGMLVGDASVEQLDRDGLKLTKICHNTTVNGVSMKQTQYVLDSDDRTYTVTVTEVVEDKALVDNVYNTVLSLK